jgi:hypothetical protein
MSLRALCGHVRALFIYWHLSNPPLSAVKCLSAPEQFEEAAESQVDICVEAAHVIVLGAQPLLRSCGRLSRVPTPLPSS